MPILSKPLETILKELASKRFALILFTLFCLSLVPGTLAETDFHVSAFSRVIIACMALNLIFCSIKRIRTIARPVLVMHFGVALTMAGSVISSLGFVGTVNIYEGSSVNAVYRWDLEKDTDLGFDLTVRKIGVEYYPVPVKIGVLKGEEKYRLIVLKTGERFDLDGYTVAADSLEMPSETLKLTVFKGDRPIGSFDTQGTRQTSADFPFDFKLVAYQNPIVKRVAVGLTLSRGGQVLAEGTSEVNSPFSWNGLYFYHTQLEQDSYGMPYAGIQIVKDPGKPVVFLGFIVLMAGSLFWMYGKMYGYRTARRTAGQAKVAQS